MPFAYFGGHYKQPYGYWWLHHLCLVGILALGAWSKPTVGGPLCLRVGVVGADIQQQGKEIGIKYSKSSSSGGQLSSKRLSG
jgi:hypothetical protein